MGAPEALEIDGDGVAWLALDRPGPRPHLLGSASLEGLDHALAGVEALAAEGRARALVVHSRRRGVFASGMDLDELLSFTRVEDAERVAQAGQRTLRRLEELPLPTIAAVEGLCLGSGVELILACAYRLACASSATRFGLPQVRFGTIPGLGGTVRLPRLVGVQASLELILTGKTIGAREAAELGLVDEILPEEGFRGSVVRFALERVEQGRRRSGVRRRVPLRLLEDTAPGRRLVFARAARRLLPGLEYAAPAPERALEAVAEAVSLPLERAFEHEARLAAELVVAGRAQALLHAYRVLQHARRAPPPAERPEIEHLGVLGAGAVGSELAYRAVSAGLPVRLRDRRREPLLHGTRRVFTLLKQDADEERITPVEAARRGERLEGTSGFGGFGTLDLVVATVGEEPEGILRALREAQEHVRDDCVLAYAPPALLPAGLGEGVGRPGRVVALHPALPLDAFPVVEIVAAEGTEPRALELCREMARRLGLVALVAPERRDTLLARLLGIYFAEAIRLLDEGAAVTAVDEAAAAFGFALGPFARMDAMGVGHALRLLGRVAEEAGERMRPARVVERLAKGEGTFYRYRAGKPAGPSPALPAGIPGDERASDVIRHRLVLALINEGARALDEGAARTPAEVDVAALVGLGFPRPRGGLLFHADRLGAARVARLLREHQERFGERFAPAPRLLGLAESGSGFHARASGQGAGGVLR